MHPTRAASMKLKHVFGIFYLASVTFFKGLDFIHIWGKGGGQKLHFHEITQIVVWMNKYCCHIVC